jgi:tRNA pseudouridine38-40 synthase
MVVLNYRLTVQYDGTDFAGFQVQPGQYTIQGELERALAVLAKEPIRIIGAGRTDAGVHAEGQVVSFKTDALTVPIDRLPIAVNSLLPFSIRVLEAQYVPPDFHARYSAVRKTYRYQVFHGPVADVFLRRFAHWVREPLDWDLMRDAAQQLIGRHDFQGYAATGSSVKTTVRTMYAIEIDTAQRVKTIRFTADGFLYNMVRNIVGTLIEVGQKRRTVESVLEVLENRNRALAGPTAPPVGLVLETVDYA